MSLTDAEVIALAEHMRERARAFMQEAADPADDSRNIAKLTGHGVHVELGGPGAVLVCAC